MATLKGLFLAAQSGNSLVVTGPHTQWLEMGQSEQVYTDKALAHVNTVLRGEHRHERSGRISPSAMGECARRVMFGFAGAPQLPPAIDNQEMMDHGSWGHLKWQAEGLSMGYMTDAEVWTHDEGLLCGGSMDATLHDGSNFELKTVGWNIYSKIVGVQASPKYEHLLQDATYKLLADLDFSSIVYEDRSSGQFHEFRVGRDARLEREVIRRLRSYKSYAEADELPDQLADCEVKIGSVYRRCPYRDICGTAKSVSEFGKVT